MNATEPITLGFYNSSVAETQSRAASDGGMNGLAVPAAEPAPLADGPAGTGVTASLPVQYRQTSPFIHVWYRPVLHPVAGADRIVGYHAVVIVGPNPNGKFIMFENQGSGVEGVAPDTKRTEISEIPFPLGPQYDALGGKWSGPFDVYGPGQRRALRARANGLGFRTFEDVTVSRHDHKL